MPHLLIIDALNLIRRLHAVQSQQGLTPAQALLATRANLINTCRKLLAGSEPTIADVSAYSYIAHAPEGNVSLDDYANVRAWLARVEALPGFVGMPRTAAGLQQTA